MKRKVIHFEDDVEKIINALCDIALKGAGLQAFRLVSQLDTLIKEEVSEEESVQD